MGGVGRGVWCARSHESLYLQHRAYVRLANGGLRHYALEVLYAVCGCSLPGSCTVQESGARYGQIIPKPITHVLLCAPVACLLRVRTVQEFGGVEPFQNP
jgi:hypothetical protein